jgi:uncharacterized protein (DUF433 family)
VNGLSVSPMIVPVVGDEFGVMYVNRTRVPLDTIVTVFEQGATAEEIKQRFSTLQLADIYAVIAYYLAHPDEVQAYMAERHQRGLEIRVTNESRSGQSGIRARLLARERPGKAHFGNVRFDHKQ